MARRPANVVILGGPNGAGKSTAAPALLKGTLRVSEFVNADVIARGLSAFDPDRAAIAAGRVMLARLQELARRHASFAFETTLATRSFAPWLEGLKRSGYRVHLVFLWLPSADAAVLRVVARSQAGGHAVPEDIVRRRYVRGLRNLFDLYIPLTDTWRVYNNAGPGVPQLIATGRGADTTRVEDRTVWERVEKAVNP